MIYEVGENMEIELTKIGEYLRIYSLSFSMSLYYNKPLFECFKKSIDEKETELSIDEYDKMILIKNYYSASMLLFSIKDTYQKGLNDVNVDNKEMFINCNIPTNKVCLENFTDKDIIIYIRNAIAHNKNNLASVFIDESNLKIKVKLENTIASKGANKGKNVPFEIEFDNDDLLRMSAFCCHFSKTINISGVDFNKNVVINSSTTNILKLLKDVIYTTNYNYTLFKTIKDEDKKILFNVHTSGNEKRDMKEFDTLKTKFVRKEETIDLSDNQKECLYNAMMEWINKSLELYDTTPLILSVSKSKDEIKRILGSFMQQYYEYEALKIIPIGKEKHNNHIVSILLNCYNDSNESIYETQVKIINDLKNKGVVYSFFRTFNMVDQEELTMFLDNICDATYLEQEALSIYYNYVFETIISEGEIITINGIQYEADRIRNAFTHGRWYFDNENNSWRLFDNKDSLKKADQYKFDWEVAIPNDEMQTFVDRRYQESIKARNRSI